MCIRDSVWIVQVLSTTTVSTPKIANPTPRQRVEVSSPFYYHGIYSEDRESHNAAACGSFKSFLPPRDLPPEIANPTARQRVDPSSPFYYQAIYPAVSYTHLRAHETPEHLV